MPTLLIRLKGPLMSWGDRLDFGVRTTRRRPTKSGVIGLCASALGYDRSADLSELNRLRFGVRTIKQGILLDDYQIMGKRPDGTPMPVEHKEYLSDADFLAGLEADDRQLLEKVAAAFEHPVFAPYLGRRGCPPAGPIRVRLSEKTLEESLGGEDLYVESSQGTLVWDQPGSKRRTFLSRNERHIPAVQATDIFDKIEESSHD